MTQSLFLFFFTFGLTSIVTLHFVAGRILLLLDTNLIIWYNIYTNFRRDYAKVEYYEKGSIAVNCINGRCRALFM